GCIYEKGPMTFLRVKYQFEAIHQNMLLQLADDLVRRYLRRLRRRIDCFSGLMTSRLAHPPVSGPARSRLNARPSERTRFHFMTNQWHRASISMGDGSNLAARILGFKREAAIEGLNVHRLIVSSYVSFCSGFGVYALQGVGNMVEDPWLLVPLQLRFELRD